jgi:hypothetical protein
MPLPHESSFHQIGLAVVDPIGNIDTAFLDQEIKRAPGVHDSARSMISVPRIPASPMSVRVKGGGAGDAGRSSGCLLIPAELLRRSELARSVTKAEMSTSAWMLLPNLPKEGYDGESHIRLPRSLARSA